MGKHKKVLKEAVSEMKHFLMGAALVLTLVTVVPALAQVSRVTPSQGQRLVEPRVGQGQSGTEQRQLGTEQRQLGTEQRQLGTEQRQLGTGQRQLGTDQRQLGTGQRQSGTGQRQSGTGQRQQGTGTDMRQEQVEQREAQQLVEPRMEQEVSEKPVAKRQAEIKIRPIDIEELEDDTSFVAVSAVAESIVDPARAAIESGTISQKKIKSFVSKVSKALRASEKQVCATFEIKDDRKACADIHKSFRNDSRNIKSTEALDEALRVFIDDLSALAEINADGEDDLFEEEVVE